jgi:hypothetical protein
MEKTSTNNKFPWLEAAVIYLISFGVSLTFLNARFWDDWYVNFTLTRSETMQYWKDMLGFFPTNRFIEVVVLDRNPVAFHLVIFFCFFLSGYLLFKILEKLPGVSYEVNKRVALLFLVLPINSARVSMVTIRLTYSLVLFLAAWLLLVNSRSNATKSIAVVLFCLSFLAQSLVPFFVLPCMHLFYLEYCVNMKSLRRSVSRSFFILCIGGVYFAAMRLLDPPPGDRIAYYTPTISGVVRAVFLLAVAAYFLWRSFRGLRPGERKDFDGVQLVALGSFSVALGAFAYIASGRLMDISEWILNFVPRASDWDSRQQLLLGLGFSLIIVGFLQLIPKGVAKRAFMLSLTACMLLNFIFMRDYLMDWKMQNQVISSLESASLPAGSKIVMVYQTDAAKKFNARGRNLRSYEWEALISRGMNRKDVSVIYNNRIDCAGDKSQIPDALMTVDATNSNMRALLTVNPGAVVTIEEIDPCGS